MGVQEVISIVVASGIVIGSLLPFEKGNRNRLVELFRYLREKSGKEDVEYIYLKESLIELHDKVERLSLLVKVMKEELPYKRRQVKDQGHNKNLT